MPSTSSCGLDPQRPAPQTSRTYLRTRMASTPYGRTRTSVTPPPPPARGENSEPLLSSQGPRGGGGAGGGQGSAGWRDSHNHSLTMHLYCVCAFAVSLQGNGLYGLGAAAEMITGAVFRCGTGLEPVVTQQGVDPATCKLKLLTVLVDGRSGRVQGMLPSAGNVWDGQASGPRPSRFRVRLRRRTAAGPPRAAPRMTHQRACVTLANYDTPWSGLGGGGGRRRKRCPSVAAGAALAVPQAPQDGTAGATKGEVWWRRRRRCWDRTHAKCKARQKMQSGCELIALCLTVLATRQERYCMWHRGYIDSVHVKESVIPEACCAGTVHQQMAIFGVSHGRCHSLRPVPTANCGSLLFVESRSLAGHLRGVQVTRWQAVVRRWSGAGGAGQLLVGAGQFIAGAGRGRSAAGGRWTLPPVSPPTHDKDFPASEVQQPPFCAEHSALGIPFNNQRAWPRSACHSVCSCSACHSLCVPLSRAMAQALPAALPWQKARGQTRVTSESVANHGLFPNPSSKFKGMECSALAQGGHRVQQRGRGAWMQNLSPGVFSWSSCGQAN
eukprot:gene5496-biopygen19248